MIKPLSLDTTARGLRARGNARNGMSGNGGKKAEGGPSGAREKEGKVVRPESKNQRKRSDERNAESVVEPILVGRASIKRRCQLSANETGFSVRVPKSLLSNYSSLE